MVVVVEELLREPPLRGVAWGVTAPSPGSTIDGESAARARKHPPIATPTGCATLPSRGEAKQRQLWQRRRLATGLGHGPASCRQTTRCPGKHGGRSGEGSSRSSWDHRFAVACRPGFSRAYQGSRRFGQSQPRVARRRGRATQGSLFVCLVLITRSLLSDLREGFVY